MLFTAYLEQNIFRQHSLSFSLCFSFSIVFMLNVQFYFACTIKVIKFTCNKDIYIKNSINSRVKSHIKYLFEKLTSEIKLYLTKNYIIYLHQKLCNILIKNHKAAENHINLSFIKIMRFNVSRIKM